MKSLLIGLVAVSFTANAQNVVETKTYTTEVMHAQKINAVVVETSEACVLTYDPQWADDEDTRGYKVLFKDYQTKKDLDALTKKGYVFKGYQNNEKCHFDGNTFPEVLTANDSQYFSVYTRNSTLLKVIGEQKAWKTVKRVYLKGIKELKESLDVKVQKAEKDILERLL